MILMKLIIVLFDKILNINYFFIKFQYKLISSNSKIIFLNKTALHIAVELENVDIVKSLLNHKNIDVNINSILINIIY